eukprot:25063-Prymnesium_polylepis.2
MPASSTACASDRTVGRVTIRPGYSCCSSPRNVGESVETRREAFGHWTSKRSMNGANELGSTTAALLSDFLSGLRQPTQHNIDKSCKSLRNGASARRRGSRI